MSVNRSAQEMVDAIAQIVSGRTINIMDKNAIIIASSDPKRIGTFHQGAAEVLASGKPVYIQKDELSRYEGAKEGINLPIVLNEKLFGVVGIYGNPDEVKDAANLLCIYVRQYFAQMALNRKENMETELRTQLLKLLLLDFPRHAEEVQQLSTLLSIKICMPVRVVVLSLGENSADPLQRLKNLNKLPGLLTAACLLNPLRDLYGVLDDHFVFLKQMDGIQNPQLFISQVWDTINVSLRICSTAAIGQCCSSPAKLRFSYQEALTLAQSGSGCFNMDNSKTRLEYLFCRLQMADEGRFSQTMLMQLQESIGEKEIDWVMTTIGAYCDCCGSIQKASAQLHVHKNTMLYRMNRIYSALKLEAEDDFTKRFFMKMLLVYYRHQG